MNLPKRAQIVMSFWGGGRGGGSRERQQRDLRLEDKQSRGKRKEADGERENEFIHGVQRGDIFEVSRSEENFIMTDNRDRDE